MVGIQRAQTLTYNSNSIRLRQWFHTRIAQCIYNQPRPLRRSVVKMDVLTTYIKLILLVILVLKFQVEGIPEAEIQQNDFVCVSTLSCKGKCRSMERMDVANATSVHCHCDPSCHKYQDCCRDIATACPSRATPLPSNVNYKCRKINDEEPMMWIVEQCPSEFKNPLVLKKCNSNDDYRSKTFFDQIPVYDMLTKTIYKNKWCGSCNGVLNLMLIYLNLRVKCNVSPPHSLNYTQALDYIIEHCDRMQFRLNQEDERRYCFPTIDSCPANSSADEKKACLQSPTAVVYDRPRTRNYRSIECMACHSTPEQLKQAECGPKKTPGNVFKPSSFEVVMKFDISAESGVKIAQKKTEVTCVSC